MAGELSALRRQERQLRRTADQYRDLLASLNADSATESGNETAMRALQNQLNRANQALAQLAERKAELESRLGLSQQAIDAGDAPSNTQPPESRESATGTESAVPGTATAPTSATIAGDAGTAATPATVPEPGGGPGSGLTPDRSSTSASAQAAEVTVPPADGPAGTAPPASSESQREVSRLTRLLESHYAGTPVPTAEPAPASTAAEQSPNTSATTPGRQEFSDVLLARDEALTVIRQFSARQNQADASGLREPDVICQVEIRREGGLVARGSHSLRALGNYQYVNKLTLQAGNVEIRVRTLSWQLTLAGSDASDYIVLLHRPALTDATLQVIPVSGLQSLPEGSLPAWLPPLAP